MNGLKTFGRIAFLAAVSLLPTLSTSHAEDLGVVPRGVYNQGFDPKYASEWKEANVPLPAYPKDADLVPVTTSPADTLKVFVDAKSLSRADDYVFRLTYVVESHSGVRNVFFEGIRCETQEYKTYAIGSADKTLVPVKNPTWQGVVKLSSNAFRHHLNRYACDISSALTPQNFLQRLKVGNYSD